MEKFSKKGIISFVFRPVSYVLLILLCSCSSCSFEGFSASNAKLSLREGIKVATWNTQTFFDSIETGNEFAEFRGKNSRWNTERYTQRLKRLCAIIEKIDADIIALQEVENEAVMRDIANMLPITSGYRFAAFAKEDSNSFGQALLSRLEIESVKTSQLFLQKQDFPAQPDLRPLLQVVCRTKNADEPSIVLFICHWKSKFGGEEKSNIWRERQEQLLLEAALSNTATRGTQEQIILGLGDFNREPQEFSSDFFTHFTGSWNSSNEGGSYFYQGNWNRIDHIFMLKSSTVQLVRFLPESEGPHTQANGTPFRYSVFSGEGYSDHLPVSAVIGF